MSSSPSREQEEQLQPIESPSPNHQSSSIRKPLNETPAQEAARLRRERRNAKIQSGGSARLDAISRLSGRRGVDSGGDGDEGGEEKDVSGGKSSGTRPAVGGGGGERKGTDEVPSQALDPDISVPVTPKTYQAFPAGRPLNPNPDHSSNVNSSTNSTNSSNTESDPVLQAMRQMLAGQDPASVPSSSSSPNDPTSNPTAALLSAFLGGGGGAASGTSFGAQHSGPAQSEKLEQQQSQTQTHKAALYWRLMHALTFFSLALHSVLYGYSSFNGTKRQRANEPPANINEGSDDQHHDPSPPATTLSFMNLNLNYWLVFLALELALQSGRFVLGGEEGINASSSSSSSSSSSAAAGSNSTSNVMATLVNLLPPPWAGYVKVSSRYWYMFRTVKADVLVFVFVLGVGVWLKA